MQNFKILGFFDESGKNEMLLMKDFDNDFFYIIFIFYVGGVKFEEVKRFNGENARDCFFNIFKNENAKEKYFETLKKLGFIKEMKNI